MELIIVLAIVGMIIAYLVMQRRKETAVVEQPAVGQPFLATTPAPEPAPVAEAVVEVAAVEATVEVAAPAVAADVSAPKARKPRKPKAVAAAPATEAVKKPRKPRSNKV